MRIRIYHFFKRRKIKSKKFITFLQKKEIKFNNPLRIINNIYIDAFVQQKKLINDNFVLEKVVHKNIKIKKNQTSLNFYTEPFIKSLQKTTNEHFIKKMFKNENLLLKLQYDF